MINPERQLAVNVTERIVGECRQMQHRIKTLTILDGDIAHVFFDIRNSRQAFAKRAGAEQIAIHADNLITLREKHGRENGADIAKVTSDENTHKYLSRWFG